MWKDYPAVTPVKRCRPSQLRNNESLNTLLTWYEQNDSILISQLLDAWHINHNMPPSNMRGRKTRIRGINIFEPSSRHRFQLSQAILSLTWSNPPKINLSLKCPDKNLILYNTLTEESRWIHALFLFKEIWLKEPNLSLIGMQKNFKREGPLKALLNVLLFTLFYFISNNFSI